MIMDLSIHEIVKRMMNIDLEIDIERGTAKEETFDIFVPPSEENFQAVTWVPVCEPLLR